MKKFKVLAFITSIVILAAIMNNGCAIPKAIADKPGSQLWAENCNRCHNAPDPKTYSDDQWDAITEHMRIKTLLTDVEIAKVRDFLKASN